MRVPSNSIRRASLLSQGNTIGPGYLGLPAAPVATVMINGDEPGRDVIERALARHGGVAAQAAAELGLSRQALYRRMERRGIARA